MTSSLILIGQLNNSLKEVRKLLAQLDDTQYNWFIATHNDYRDQSIEEDFKIEHLEETIASLKESIGHEIFMIRVRLLSLIDVKRFQFLSQIIDEIHSDSSLAVIKYYDYANIFVSPKLHRYESIFEVINELLEVDEDIIKSYRLLDLERLLKNTGNIFFNENYKPKSENDIQKKMYNYIRSYFPSTVRESSLPKVTTTYKVDFSIRSLSTCVEFKYVTSKRQAKKIMGGLFEDIHAYAGYKDWTNFIAVIYMTEHFLTEEQISEMVKSCDVPDNWKFIITYGNGLRNNSQKIAPSSSRR